MIEDGPPDHGVNVAPPPPVAPTTRYNAMGVLEEYAPNTVSTGTDVIEDIGPAETPSEKQAVVRRDPVIVGAGRARSVSDLAAGPAAPIDWTSVGRNDACPCGSGKKFKKCHGASM